MYKNANIISYVRCGVENSNFYPELLFLIYHDSNPALHVVQIIYPWIRSDMPSSCYVLPLINIWALCACNTFSENAKRQIVESLADLTLQSIELEVNESVATVKMLTEYRYTLQHHEHIIVICGQKQLVWLLKEVRTLALFGDTETLVVFFRN